MRFWKPVTAMSPVQSQVSGFSSVYAPVVEIVDTNAVSLVTTTALGSLALASYGSHQQKSVVDLSFLDQSATLRSSTAVPAESTMTSAAARTSVVPTQDVTAISTTQMSLSVATTAAPSNVVVVKLGTTAAES